MGQQLKKLVPSDFLSVRGQFFKGLPCGANTPIPEADLEKLKDHGTDIDRQKWLGYIRRAKNVMEGYDKWWSSISITLRDGRRIILDGNDFFCVRTKNPKTFYYFKLEKKDFEELSQTWNDILRKVQ